MLSFLNFNSCFDIRFIIIVIILTLLTIIIGNLTDRPYKKEKDYGLIAFLSIIYVIIIIIMTLGSRGLF